MARQSRQARRAQERRYQHQHRHQPQRLRIGWQTILGAAVVVAFAALLGFKAATNNSGSGSPTAQAAGARVGSIMCDSGMSESSVYHIHARLAVMRDGKPIPISSDAGHYYDQDCLFWMHAHDGTGIIHLESPKVTRPTLDTWLKILAKTEPNGAPNIDAGAGQQRKVWVNMKPYSGDPRNIVITQHEQIWIDIGPPLPPPQKFDFAAHGV